MQGDPKWYDSLWLQAWYAAKDVVAKVAPAQFDEFVASFDVLRTRLDFSARHLAGEISPELLERIRAVVKTIPQEKFEMHEMKSFGRFVVHDWPAFTALQHELTDQVCAWAGEDVEPFYNFLSLYTRMGMCEPHLDAPAAKWTIDICIDQSEPWPIHFSQIVPWPEERPNLADDWREEIRSNRNLQFRSVAMVPGDAILFSGSSQWHYREALPRDGKKRFCDLLFLHYVPKGSNEILYPKNWARIFNIPEIAEIPGIETAL